MRDGAPSCSSKCAIARMRLTAAARRRWMRRSNASWCAPRRCSCKRHPALAQLPCRFDVVEARAIPRRRTCTGSAPPSRADGADLPKHLTLGRGGVAMHTCSPNEVAMSHVAVRTPPARCCCNCSRCDPRVRAIAQDTAAAANPCRVLFVGNSLTYVNDLPSTLRALAAAQPTPVRSKRRPSSRRAAPLAERWNDGKASAALGAGHWDAVVLQERGGLLACMVDGEQRSQPECRASERAHRDFAARAKAAGTKTYVLATWGPDDTWQTKLDRAAKQLARRIDADIIPAGTALRALARSQRRQGDVPRWHASQPGGDAGDGGAVASRDRRRDAASRGEVKHHGALVASSPPDASRCACTAPPGDRVDRIA
jgi:hypothetical protein